MELKTGRFRLEGTLKGLRTKRKNDPDEEKEVRLAAGSWRFRAENLGPGTLRFKARKRDFIALKGHKPPWRSLLRSRQIADGTTDIGDFTLDRDTTIKFVFSRKLLTKGVSYKCTVEPGSVD